MRKYLNNGIGPLAIIILAVIGAAITYGELWGDVKDTKALAADNKIKVEKAVTDIEVEKEKVIKIEKNQEQYNADARMNSSFQAGQLVETSYIKQNIKNLGDDMKEIKELLLKLVK